MSRNKARVGLYMFPGPGRDAGFERALWAENRGYDDIWFPDGEGCQDALTLVGATAARTSRIRICTGVVPVYTRPPAVLATTALAINHLAPGRFVLGLGASAHAMVDGWYGIPFEKPLSRVRETVQVLRGILAGEKTDFQGRTLRTKGFRLNQAVNGEIPIYLAAMGPKMLELAGECADGVVFTNFTPAERVSDALERIDTGAKRAGRRVEDIEIVSRIVVNVTGDTESTFEFFRSQVTMYGAAPVYQAAMAALGYGEAVEKIKEGYAARDRKRVLEAVDEEMVRRFYVWGDEAACHTRVREFINAGVHTVAVAPLSHNSDEFEATCEAFAPDNFATAV